jgi:hypothetical protein
MWLERDASPTVNRTELGFWCTDVRTVVFVGSSSDFGAMPYAVSPGGNPDLSGIETDFISAEQTKAILASKPLAVVLTWESLPPDEPSATALQGYVRQGGTLFVVPEPDTSIAISHPAPAWIGVNPGALVKTAKAEPVVLLREGDSIWQSLRGADGRPQFGLLRLFQYCPLKTGADGQVLIASANGAPLLVRRALDDGQIYLSGLAFTPPWSSLPLKAGFVVLMQNAVFGARSENIPVQAIRAGEAFHFDFPEAETTIKSLAGSALDWHGQARVFEGFPRAGVYEIGQRDHVAWAAVRGNADEADPHYLPVGPVPILHNLPHQVVPLIHEDDILRTELSPNSGLSLYRWLLLLGLLVLLAESWLANERSSDLGRKLFRSLIPTALQAKATAKRKPEPTKV